MLEGEMIQKYNELKFCHLTIKSILEDKENASISSLQLLTSLKVNKKTKDAASALTFAFSLN